MRFLPTVLPGAFIIDLEPVSDERGFFARTWCTEECATHGVKVQFSQSSISFNRERGTLRGMHYQAAPYEEAKLVRVTRGAIYDVVLDVRPRSAAFGKHVGVELTGDNRRMLYIPEGCANGFQTLTPDAEVFYQISVPYEPASARGIRYDDPFFDVRWPLQVSVINERDRSYPDYRT